MIYYDIGVGSTMSNYSLMMWSFSSFATSVSWDAMGVAWGRFLRFVVLPAVIASVLIAEAGMGGWHLAPWGAGPPLWRSLLVLLVFWSHSDLMWFQGYSKDWSFLTMVSNLASGWPFSFAVKLRLRDSGIEVLFQTNLSRGLGKYPFSVSGWRGRSLKKNCTDSLRHVEPCGAFEWSGYR